MRQVTDRFLETIRRSHTFRTEVDLSLPGQGPIPLELIDGSVTMDRTAQQRTRAKLTIPSESVSTAEFLDFAQLASGSEVAIRTGLMYPDDTQELVTVATLRVDDVEFHEDRQPSVLSCVDRSQQVADSHPVDPIPFIATDVIEAAIIQLVLDVLPNIETITPGHAETFGKAVVVEEDRWLSISEWAAGLGCEPYFDANGNFVLAEIPAFTDAAVWTIDTGTEGVMIDYDSTTTRRGVFNGVKAMGQPVDGGTPPVSFLAIDDDPTSPTYWDGPFGHVLAYLHGETITTNAQAQRAAEALLATLLGVVQTVNLGTIPNPALEPDDAVAVIRTDGGKERHLIDSVTIPLGVKGNFTLNTRSA